MSTKYARKPLLFASLFLLFVLFWGVHHSFAQDDGNALLRDAWQRTERVGSYDFTTQLTQTTYPAPRITAIGRSAKYDTLYLRGTADRQAGTLQLSLWDDPDNILDPEHAMEMRIEGTHAYGRAAGGNWQEIDDISNAFAPTGDAAAFLNAARNVRPLGQETRSLPTPNGGTHEVTIERYAFTLDGERYAENMRRMLQDQLRASGELPNGVNLGINDYFRNAVGDGEAWLDANGMPLRLTLAIEFPQDRKGERTMIDLQTDFVAYKDAARVSQVAFISNPLRWTMAKLPPLPTMITTAKSTAWTIGGFALLLLVFVLVWLRPKKAYKFIAPLLTAQMVFAPLASPSLYDEKRMQQLQARFSSASQTDDDSVQPETLPDQQPVWNALQSPLEAGRRAYQSKVAAVTATADRISEPNRTPTNSGIDIDQDGLYSDEEAHWGLSDTNPDNDGDGVPDGAEVALCPVRVSTIGNPWEHPDNVADPACADPYYKDTDSDGLTDSEEILYLGTFANTKDSDNDGISDYNEVHGFLMNGTRYYTDARNLDTDGDGLLDGAECSGLRLAEPWTATTTCEDTNNKGIADVLSIDNDGDDVPNNSDFSPFTAIKPTGYFNDNNPLQLRLENLAQGEPVLVDIQIRPQDEQQLAYALNVLDWPTGDNKGQIQRLVGSTFGDQDPNTPLDDPAYNGDMRITPLLEFRMAGDSVDLPRKTADHTMQVTNAGQLVGQVVFEKVDDTTTALKVERLTANNATLTILAGSCLNGASVYSTAVFETFNQTFNNTTLGYYADGSHSLQLEADSLTHCEPIASVVDGSEKVPVQLQKAGSPLGTVNFLQTGNDTQLKFEFEDEGLQFDARIYNSSCQQQTNLEYEFTTIFDSNTRLITNKNVIDLADGSHSIVWLQNDKSAGCAPIGNVVNGSLTTMIDLDALAAYQISVNEDINGDLLAMTPLSLQEDQDTGARIAFNGRMLYERGTTTPLQHEVNLVWTVTMLTDNCPDGDCTQGVTNQPQIVHTYRGESWYVTGLTIQEELGMDVAVVYENPANDYNTDANSAANRNLEFDDNLWWLARSLNRTFISGRDNDANNIRDIQIADVIDRWNNPTSYAYTDDERFGIRPDAFNIADYHYEQQADLATLNSVEIPAILNNNFGNGTFPQEDLFHRETTTVAPTFLIAREEQNRTLSLDEMADNNTVDLVSVVNNLVTFDLDATYVEPVVTTSLSWKPFRYNDAKTAWEAYPIREYWDRMERLFSQAPDFASDLAADENAAYEATANLIMAQNIYLYFYQGVGNSVQFGTELTFTYNNDDNPSDTDLAEDAAFIVAQGKEYSGLMAKYVAEMYEPLEQEYTRYKRIKGRPTKRLEIIRDITLKGAIGRASTQVKSAIVEDINISIGEFRAAGMRGRIVKLGQWGLAAGAVGLGVASNFFEADSDDASERAIARSIAGISAAKEIYGGVQIIKAYKTWKLFRPDAAFNLTAFAKTMDATKAAKIASVIGAVIEVAIAFGTFLYQMIAAGVTAFSLVFNEALAGFVGTAVVAVLLAALAFTGVGAIIVAVIAIIDGLIALFCGLYPPDKESEDLGNEIYTYFCKGISGLMAELVAFILYDQTDIIKLDDADRLKFIGFNPYLIDPAAGFVPNAALAVEVKVRNTVETSSPNGLGVTYFWQFNETNTRSAAFNYDLVNAPVTDEDEQLHNQISRWDHRYEWVGIGDDKYYIERTVLETNDIALPPPGINQSVAAYFAEGHQSPTQECILIPVSITPPIGIPECWVRSNEKSSYNDLGIIFDVFPATLNDFYDLTDKDGGRALAWDESFPVLQDADGDGLHYTIDPDDDTADNDGDDLEDLREIQLGTDATKNDSDSDFVEDGDEIRNKTNPLQADSDSDGLPDGGNEFMGGEREGWMITYNLAGDQTQVWPDPLSADADNDLINDRREKALGFNPWVPNDPTVLTYDTDLRETEAPFLHLRLDEMSGADTFIDSARPDSFYAGSCAGDLCPVAGILGEIGSAAAFDGSDDFLTLGVVNEVNAYAGFYTVGAWIRPNHTIGTQYVIGTSRHHRDDGFAFGLEGSEIRFDLFPEYTFLSSGAALPIGAWTHIAAAVFPTTVPNQLQAIFYVNGVQQSVSQVTIVNPLPEDSSDELLIGAVYQHNTYTGPGDKPEEEPYITELHFDGRIDEVALYGAFTTLQAYHDLIAQLHGGRYNPDDGVVLPGQALEYESNIRNQLLSRGVDGLLTTNLPDVLSGDSYFEPVYQFDNFVLGPRGGSGGQTSELNQLMPLFVDNDAPTGDYEIVQTAGAIVDVPPVPLPGQFAETVFLNDAQHTFNGTWNWRSFWSEAYRVDGANDFTIALWVKPDNVTGRRGIMGWDSGEADGYPSIHIEDGKIAFGFGSNGGWRTDTTNNVYLSNDTWTHIAISFTKANSTGKLYIDGEYAEDLNFSGYNPTTTGNFFNIGRSTNIGRIAFSDVTIKCEDDGGGARFDLVGYKPENSNPQTLIWGQDFPDDTEDETINIGQTEMFREYMDFAMCENDTDDSDHSTCDSDDDFLGRQRFHVYDPAISITNGLFSTTPSDSTCTWYEGYDDWAELDYNFYHDSLPYDGLTKDVRLIQRSITPFEVKDLLESNEIIARYKFNDRPGSRVFEDDVAATIGECVQQRWCPASGVDGIENVGLYFDGSLKNVEIYAVNYLLSEHLALPTSTGYSFGAWIKPEDTGKDQTVMAFTDWGLLNPVKLTISPDFAGNFYVSYTDDAVGLVTSVNTFPMDAWHHIFVTINTSGFISLYVDGFVEQFGVTSVLAPPSAGKLNIGHGWEVHPVNGPDFHLYRGYLDDVYIGKDLASAADVLNIMQGAPTYRWRFDDDGNEANTYLEGQIAESLEIDSAAESVPLGTAGSLNLWTYDDYTFTAWVRGNDITVDGEEVYLPLLGSPNANSNVLFIGLHNGIPLAIYDGRYHDGLTQYWIEASQAIPPDQWTHLAFKLDDGTFTIYVNGTEVQSGFVGSMPGNDNIPINLGAGYVPVLSSSKHWNGRVDDVALYSKALGDEEIVRLFNFQVTWVDEKRLAPFTVDADVPTGTLQTLPAFLPKAATTFLIDGHDVGSTAVAAKLFGIEMGHDAQETDSYASPCIDADGNTAFCALFDPPLEGQYELFTTVIDQVGHESPWQSGGTLVVDDSLPLITLNPLPTTPLRPEPDGSEAALWSLALSGTAVDSQILYDYSAIYGPGSGIAEVSVTLFDANGAPMGEPASQTASRSGDNWNLNYQLRADNPTGTFTGEIVSIDVVGNQATLPIPQFVIDATAPKAEITDYGAPPVTVGSGRSAATIPLYLGSDSTLAGIVSERPLDTVAQNSVAGIEGVQISAVARFEQGSPFINSGVPSGTQLYHPFDQSGASEVISDTTFIDIANGLSASCSGANCPISGSTSRNGQGLQFDGIDDILTMPHDPNINGLVSDFSVAAWIKPNALTGDSTILTTSINNSYNGYLFGIYYNQLAFYKFDSSVCTYLTQPTIETNVWTHVAAHVKANHDVDFYKNGILIETLSGCGPIVPDTNDDLYIGGNNIGGGYWDVFDGVIDELMVKAGGLSADEWTTIMGLGPTMHLTFDELTLGDGAVPVDKAGMGAAASFSVYDNTNTVPNHNTKGIVGGGALRLDSNDMLTVTGDAGILPHNVPFTLAFWVQDAPAYYLWFDEMGFEKYDWANSFAFYGPGGTYCEAPIGEPAGTHHVAISADGVTPLKVYWDGVLMNAAAGCPVITTLGTVNDLIFNSVGYPAVLDDLRVYQRVLSEQELEAMVQSRWQDVSLSGSSFTTTDAPIAIPDGTGTDACQTIDVTGIGTSDLAEVTIKTALTHTWVGDLKMTIEPPNSFVFTLIDRPGYIGSGNGFNANLDAANPISFFDGGSTPAEDMGSTLSTDQVVCRDDGNCTYQPAFDPFAFGVNGDGTWKLCVNDNAGQDIGTLDSWSLSFASAAAQREPDGSRIEEATWSGNFSTGLEGYYDLQIRAADTAGNVDKEPATQWSGIIDTTPPRVTLVETADSGTWYYRFSANDFNLMEDTLTLPAACAGNTSTLQQDMYQAPWYLAFAAQTSEDPAQLERLVFLEVECAVTSPLPSEEIFSICDLTGNCSESIGQCSTPPVTNESVAAVGNDVQLSWSSSEPTANIYREANAPYFTPTSVYANDSSPWNDPDTGEIGNVAANYYYLLRATGSCGESGNSQRLGEFDFAIVPGN